MAKSTPSTATLGEVAPAAERVEVGTSPTAPAPEMSGGTAVVGSVAEAAALLDAPQVPLREVPGPGVGAERVAERVETVRDRPLGDTAPAAPLPPATLIDPDDVPGRRRVAVATLVTHDGLDHTPDHADPERRSVLLDFRQYSDLQAIGAVIPLSSRDVHDWADDED